MTFLKNTFTTYGVRLGFVFLSINIVLTFGNFSPSVHSYLSYLTVPAIILFSGLSSSTSISYSKSLLIALTEVLKTLYLGLLIGFVSLFTLNTLFFNIVSINPYYTDLFSSVTGSSMWEFLLTNTYQAAIQSTIVSTVIALISGLVVFVYKRR